MVLKSFKNYLIMVLKISTVMMLKRSLNDGTKAFFCKGLNDSFIKGPKRALIMGLKNT